MREENRLLGDKNCSANIAVRDLEVAKDFYENTLGLDRISTFEDEVIVYKSGNSSIVVYRSEFAGTNKLHVLHEPWEKT